MYGWLVRGSKECYDAIQSAHATVGTLFASASGRARLAALLNGTGINASRLHEPRYQLEIAGRGLADCA